MVRAALTPLSITSQFAVEWLYKYFEHYAENALHLDYNKLIIADKRSAWKEYKSDYKNNAISENVLDYSSFIQLWNATFPEYVTRR